MTKALSGDSKAPVELIEYRLCEKFGWTPEQVAKQSAKTINHYLTIMNIENQLREAEAKSGKR